MEYNISWFHCEVDHQCAWRLAYAHASSIDVVADGCRLRLALFHRARAESQPQRVEQIKRDAAKGNPVAQTNMGVLLWEGMGVPVNKEEAISWFQKAAEKGEPQAHYALGLRYEAGNHVKKDLNAALNHYTIAARKGQALAMSVLVNHFDAGRGLPEDPAKAISLVDEILAHTPKILDERRLPAEKKFEFFRDVISVLKKLNEKQDRLPGFEKVKKLLVEHGAAPSYYHAVVGDFQVSYAWDARTSNTIDQVTEEQYKEFIARLKPAVESLEKAWELDTKNANAATRRINAAMGLGEKREVMELWFRRAIDANPQSLEPYRAKLLYLEPKWQGDEAGEQFLSFAHECGKSTDWKTRIPFLLVESHQALSKYPRKGRTTFSPQPDPTYFEEEGVWKEVQSVFDAFLELNPDDHVKRSQYARFACWAKDWKKANALFEELGDKLDVSAFSSEEELTKFKQQAAAEGK